MRLGTSSCSAEMRQLHPDGLEAVRFPSDLSETTGQDMVGLEGFEPPTHGLGNRCSILLSYRPARRILVLV